MPDHLCKVKYRDLDHAISNCLELISRIGETMIFYAKTDVQLAFRLVPLLLEQFCWLVMKAKDPESGFFYYFVDKCLPFGASISCAVFQAFSDALAHILQHLVKRRNCLTNYLDDFLFIATLKIICDQLVAEFLKMCQIIGCPIAEEKTEWSTVRIIFLGILLDGQYWILAIPDDKRRKAIQLIQDTLSKKMVTIKDLQKLAGSLNFLCRAVFVGRTFIRRIYNLMMGNNGLLKQHHHVRVNSELKEDCRMWLTFLNEETNVFCCPFVDLNHFETSHTLNFYTNSSANESLGYSCVFNDRWIFGQWEPNFVRINKPSIEYLELAALCIGILTLGGSKELHNTRVIIFCDNQVVMHMVNNCSSKCKNCMFLIRKLVLDGLRNNCRVFMRFVPSKKNFLADSLSRLKLKQFKEAAPYMRPMPDCPTPEIWPLSKVWIN